MADSTLLWSRFEEGTDYEVDPETGCWLWLRRRDQFDYGVVSWSKYGTGRAARVSYIMAHGLIPKGDHVHHKCKNPPCINPAHLEHLTPREHFLHHKLEEKTGLSLDDVREIRRLGRIQGYTSHGVAEMYGIHWRTVDDYWGGRRWAAEFGDGPCRPVGPCATCGTTFTAEKSRKQRYCSEACRNQRWRNAA